MNSNLFVMKYIYILSVFLLASSVGRAQTQDNRIHEELKQWDPVRGEWLAKSFDAMANNQPIPDRTFPENLTPMEVYSKVPVERQKAVQTIVTENQRNANENNRVVWDRMVSYTQRPNCQLVMGRTYGDPHITSFDGQSFSFQTVGEFVLVKSASRNIEVQARQKPQSENISLNTAVAMNVHGDRVGIYASDFPDQLSGTPVRVNGRAMFINNETYYLPHGGTIENNGREYIVTWPTGEKVQAKLARTGGMDFMNISVFIYPCMDMYNGVMGNANGTAWDDFGGRGNDMAASRVFDPFGSREFGRGSAAQERTYQEFLARDYANGFRVTDLTSLFDYDFGRSTWSFTDLSFPRTYLTLSDLSQADRDRAMRECRANGIGDMDMNGCVYDVAYARIPPTPRPVDNDRTSGRDFKPVTEPVVNVNRPNVGTSSTPINSTTEKFEGNRSGNGGSEPIGIGSEGKVEQKTEPETAKPISIGNTKPIEKQPESKAPVQKQPSVEKKPTYESKPVEEKKPSPKPQVQPVEKQPESKPIEYRKLEPVSKPVERPAPEPTPTPKPAPVERQSTPVSKPSPTPTPVSKPGVVGRGR